MSQVCYTYQPTAASIRDARQRLEMSEARFGAHVGVSEKLIRQWEVDEEVPAVDKASYQSLLYVLDQVSFDSNFSPAYVLKHYIAETAVFHLHGMNG